MLPSYPGVMPLGSAVPVQPNGPGPTMPAVAGPLPPGSPGGAPPVAWRYATPPVIARDRVPMVLPVLGVGAPRLPTVSGIPGPGGYGAAGPRLPWPSGYGR